MWKWIRRLLGLEPKKEATHWVPPRPLPPSERVIRCAVCGHEMPGGVCAMPSVCPNMATPPSPLIRRRYVPPPPKVTTYVPIPSPAPAPVGDLIPASLLGAALFSSPATSPEPAPEFRSGGGGDFGGAGASGDWSPEPSPAPEPSYSSPSPSPSYSAPEPSPAPDPPPSPPPAPSPSDY